MTAPSSVAIVAADVLEQAADVLLRDGHAKGHLGVDTQPKCVIGAVSYVIEGDAAAMLLDEPSSVYQACYSALKRMIAQKERWAYTSLPHWNDSPRRTLDDVVTTCRSAARYLRGEST